jgi:hypothetical protein
LGWIVLLALVTAVGACGLTELEIESPQNGVVRFVDVEGGCWAIDTGQTRLQPINLTEPFRVDGLAVSFAAEARPDLASICMVGQIVELTAIQARQP